MSRWAALLLTPMAVLQGAQVQLDLSDLGEGDGAGVLACELRVVPPATVKR